MSGAGIICCRVCGSPLKRETDYIDHTLVESSEECLNCRMYASEFQYGTSWERYGVIECAWDHTENRPGDWRAEEAEAKQLLSHPDGRAWVDAYMKGDNTARLASADWCAEQGLVLTEAYIRGVVEWEGTE